MTPLLRNALLVIGVLSLLSGVVVAAFWLRSGMKPNPSAAVDLGAAVLVAARPIAAGTLLRESDMAWQGVAKAKPPAASFVRGETSASELVGGLARRDIATGEILLSTALLRPGERGFLAATLTRGFRALTIPVDARQSASGLVLPGDRVDVVLVQDLADTSPDHKAVGEIVLANARVVAVGHSMGPAPKAAASTLGSASSVESALPQTMTIEVLPVDAQRLFVAGEIGKLELALRPVGEQAPAPGLPPLQPVSLQPVSIWAGDVSRALHDVGARPAHPGPAIAVRQGPSPMGWRRDAQTSVLIIRGSRGDGK
jgi:pilus assembly protein CpaB